MARPVKGTASRNVKLTMALTEEERSLVQKYSDRFECSNADLFVGLLTAINEAGSIDTLIDLEEKLNSCSGCGAIPAMTAPLTVAVDDPLVAKRREEYRRPIPPKLDPSDPEVLEDLELELELKNRQRAGQLEVADLFSECIKEFGLPGVYDSYVKNMRRTMREGNKSAETDYRDALVKEILPRLKQKYNASPIALDDKLYDRKRYALHLGMSLVRLRMDGRYHELADLKLDYRVLCGTLG